MARQLAVGRVMTAPGQSKPKRDVILTLADGRIASVEPRAGGGDGAGLIAVPAMINAHDHGYGIAPIAFGATDDALECWITGLSVRPSIDPKLEALAAFGRMALGGIGATVHCHNSLVADRLEAEVAGVAQAQREVGIRVAFCCPILDRNAWVYGGPSALLPWLSEADRARLSNRLPREVPARHLVAQVEAIASQHETDMFQIQYGPIGPQWCHDATLEAIAEASAARGRRIHMHLLESRRQREWLDARYPGGVVKFLDKIGFLSPRLTVAHGVWLSEDDCALLAERGVTVALNTSSNLRLRSGMAPVQMFQRHGIRFAFGLDGSAFDDDQDFLRDLRLAWLLHNGSELDSRLSPDRLFQAAYRDAFPVVGGSGAYGRIKPGTTADIAIYDYHAMARDIYVDDVDAAEVFLTRGTARHLNSVFVAGREVVRDGALPDLDLAAVENELHARARADLTPSPRQRALIGRQREATRRYYADGAHTKANR
ncbi:MAG: amidohydrolase family protein [Alphaproteobacteria bacterium]|nr:amidohydrolase family protein [Alphaproteobacteria bacterium]